MGLLEKIAEVEKEISRTQKNKGTVNYAAVTFASERDAQLALLLLVQEGGGGCIN